MKNFLKRKLHILLMIIVITVCFGVQTMPAHAEGGSIRLTYDPQVEGLDETEFTLYRVGSFSGPDLVLLDEFKPSGARVDWTAPGEDATDEEVAEWRDNWLKSASTLDLYLKSLGDGKPEPAAGPTTVKAGSDMTFGPLDNGLYLLVGTEQRVGDKYWRPVPALVMVLNSEADFEISDLEIKMSSRTAVRDHMVRKIWDDLGHEDMRPESIRAELYYGDELYDTVILSDENNWTYKWQSDVDEEYSWSVREYCVPKDKELWNHYEPFVAVLDGDGGGCETFDINNPYKACELDIIKIFESADGKKAGVKADVDFEIIGYVNVDGEKEEYYHEDLTIRFNGEDEKTVTVSDIPIRLDELVVREGAGTGYKPKNGETEKIAAFVTDPADGKRHYQVEFTNVLSDNPEPPAKTGDSTVIGSYILTLMASATLLVLLLTRKRQRPEV